MKELQKSECLGAACPRTKSDTRIVLAKSARGGPCAELEMVKRERVNGWALGYVFRTAKVPNAKGPREQPHTSPTRHMHVAG